MCNRQCMKNATLTVKFTKMSEKILLITKAQHETRKAQHERTICFGLACEAKKQNNNKNKSCRRVWSFDIGPKWKMKHANVYKGDKTQRA